MFKKERNFSFLINLLFSDEKVFKKSMTQRLKTLYTEKIRPKFYKDFQYKNIHEVPALQKIVINRGIGDASQNAKILETFLKGAFRSILTVFIT